jgi:hypothetical protein
MVTQATYDPYAQAALDEIIAHPNDPYALSPNVYAKVAQANGGVVPPNAQLGAAGDWSYAALSCKYFGANCTNDSAAVTADCPWYLRALSMCKAGGYVNRDAVQAQQDTNAQAQSSGCAVCDQISAWFGKASKRIVVVIVGFVLLYGAFLVYKK